jgi:hypothetical protein
MSPAIVLLTLAQVLAGSCLPQFWGGVLAGSTDRQQVERLLGQGVFVPSENGFPVSYFLDPDNAITVRIEYGTDSLVQTLDVIEGNRVPERIKGDESLVSEFLQPPFVFGGLGDIKFGASLESVKTNMGPPTRVLASDELQLVYVNPCSCELEGGISFSFVGGRLVKVSYWQSFG